MMDFEELADKLRLFLKKEEDGGKVPLAERRDLYHEIKIYFKKNPDTSMGRMRTKIQVDALKFWAKASIKDKDEKILVKEEASKMIKEFLGREEGGYFQHASKIIYNVLPILERKPEKT